MCFSSRDSGLHAAFCSSGQSPASRIYSRPQSRSTGCWLRPPGPRLSAHRPIEAEAGEPSSSSSSCPAGGAGGRRERLRSGSDRTRKNRLQHRQNGSKWISHVIVLILWFCKNERNTFKSLQRGSCLLQNINMCVWYFRLPSPGRPFLFWFSR